MLYDLIIVSLQVYSEDNKGVLPTDLSDLTKILAYNLGYTDFNPQAAIINYYHIDSTLSGHTDHSEVNLTAPLFSVRYDKSIVHF